MMGKARREKKEGRNVIYDFVERNFVFTCSRRSQG